MTRPPVTAALGACLACVVLSAFAQLPLGDDWPARGDVIGEALSLRAGERTVIALHREGQRKKGRGAVLLLHAPGGSADGAGLVRRLRLGLSEAGWSTLSLQLPVWFPSDSPQGWLDRNAWLATSISAGLNWLAQRGLLNQAIIAMGPSGQAAIAFGAKAAPPELQAIVLISTALKNGTVPLDQLAGLRLPVLDLYAEHDHPDVQDTAPVKRKASVANAAYRQRVVADADNRFTGAADTVVSYVRAWLAANADGKQVNIER